MEHRMDAVLWSETVPDCQGHSQTEIDYLSWHSCEQVKGGYKSLNFNLFVWGRGRQKVALSTAYYYRRADGCLNVAYANFSGILIVF